MNGSPISSWEGAAAVFTFADSPVAMGLFLILSIALCVGVIAGTIAHENKSFRR